MPRKFPRIDVRDKRLPGERLNISARAHGREAQAREQMVRDLIEAGRMDIIERIRSRELALSEVRAAVKAGDMDRLRAVVSSDITLGRVLDRVLDRVKGGNVAGTIKQYRNMITQFEKYFGRDTLISDITAEQAESFLFGPKKQPKRSAHAKPWSSVRQGQARDLGAQAWDLAIADELEHATRINARPRLTRNPWRAIKVGSARGRQMVRPAFLQRDEWMTLEDSNRDLPELAMCALGCLGGLREGEAVNLRPGVDIDMGARIIRIQERTGLHAWKPKTPGSSRTVPINERLYAILQRHFALGFAGERYVIRLPRLDQPIALFTAQRWTQRAFERAGIKYGRNADGLTNHSLRHTFGSWLAQEDVQLMKIGTLMGDTIETVAKYYAHLLPADLDRAVRVLDSTLSKVA